MPELCEDCQKPLSNLEKVYRLCYSCRTERNNQSRKEMDKKDKQLSSKSMKEKCDRCSEEEQCKEIIEDGGDGRFKLCLSCYTAFRHICKSAGLKQAFDGTVLSGTIPTWKEFVKFVTNVKVKSKCG